jgi:hypothetical protein
MPLASTNKTVRERIVDRIVDGMKNISEESYIRATVGVGASAASSGTYGGTSHKKFELEVTGANEITYTNLTDSDTPVVQAVTSGVAFDINATDIGDTGIDVTVTYTGSLTIGDKWDLRLNKSFMTLEDVYPWWSAMQDPGLPSLMVVDTREDKKIIQSGDTHATYDCDLEINLVLRYREIDRASNEINRLVGDIENEMNRDINLQESDGTCLSIMTEVVSSEIFITEGTQEMVGALIEARVIYRHRFTDTREVLG